MLSEPLSDRRSRWLSAIRKQLAGMEQLKDDWDSYGAAAPQLEIVTAAEHFAHLVASNSDVIAPFVHATRSGGALFVWRAGTHQLEARFVSPSSASFAYLQRDTNVSEKGILLSESREGRFWDLLNLYFASCD